MNINLKNDENYKKYKKYKQKYNNMKNIQILSGGNKRKNAEISHNVNEKWNKDIEKIVNSFIEYCNTKLKKYPKLGLITISPTLHKLEKTILLNDNGTTLWFDTITYSTNNKEISLTFRIIQELKLYNNKHMLINNSYSGEDIKFNIKKSRNNILIKNIKEKIQEKINEFNKEIQEIKDNNKRLKLNDSWFDYNSWLEWLTLKDSD